MYLIIVFQNLKTISEHTIKWSPFNGAIVYNIENAATLMMMRTIGVQVSERSRHS